MALSFRWAEHEDTNEVEAFIVTHYGPDSPQATPGRFRWLFRDHPLGLHVALCHDGSNLVAFCGHLPVRLLTGDRVLAAAYGIDFMVDPAYRRRGIGRQILEMRLERFTLGLSSGQSRAMAELYEKAGAIRLADYENGLYVRRLLPRRSPRLFLRDLAAWALGRTSRSARGVRTPVYFDAAYAWINENQDVLVSADAGVQTGATEFRWRFDGPVYRDYRFSLVRGDVDTEGLLVYRLDGKTEVIVGLFCTSPQRALLLRTAAETSLATRIRFLYAGHTLGRDVRRAGFLVRPVAATAVAMTRDHNTATLLRSCDWQATANDADIDLLRRPRTA